MSETKDMLEQAIQVMIEDLSVIDTEEKSKAVDDLSKMYHLLIEEKKLERDEIDSEEQRKFEAEKENRQYEFEKENVKFKRAIEIGGVAAPMIFYSVWMIAGFHYEKTGMLVSDTFKQFTRLFRPFTFK